MRPALRRIAYATSFEAGGIVMGGLVLHLISRAPVETALGLSTLGAIIALLWSYLYNSLFEAWESRQPTRGRSFRRRASHAVLYETGLTLILLPVTAWWLSTTLLAAFFYEASLIVFFLIYAWAFTWGFDRLFGLPQSAR